MKYTKENIVGISFKLHPDIIDADDTVFHITEGASNIVTLEWMRDSNLQTTQYDVYDVIDKLQNKRWIQCSSKPKSKFGWKIK